MLISSISTEAFRSLVSALDDNNGMYRLPSFGNVSTAYITANSEASREELLEALSESCDTILSEQSEVEEIAASLGEDSVSHLMDAINSQFEEA